jgi:hypothetical protein
VLIPWIRVHGLLPDCIWSPHPAEAITKNRLNVSRYWLLLLAPGSYVRWFASLCCFDLSLIVRGAWCDED